jgi:hypothetical protein
MDTLTIGPLVATQQLFAEALTGFLASGFMADGACVHEVSPFALVPLWASSITLGSDPTYVPQTSDGVCE